MVALPLRRRAPFDRTRILAKASRARAKGRRHKAISLYRWLLAVEPRTAELHSKLAPLLAETGHEFDAGVSYQATANTYVRQGHTDKAVGIYREASRYLPREVKIWHAIARLQCKAGHENEAVETLLEGSRQFRARWARPQAIFLLRRAREIAAWDFEVVLDLARLLASLEQRQESEMLLEHLAARATGEPLRRVRAAQVWISPGPYSAWCWLKIAWSDAGDEEDTPAAPVAVLRPRQRGLVG